ncbi:hypothetical protein BUE80_DR012041 [Diplocarpon rosae]|nr:hypothetical protein BUE80_DR012041 [Diplocarpon rosae]
MPLFALPLAPSSTVQFAQPQTSRAQFSTLPVRKRKRPHSSPPPSDDENSSSDEQHGAAASTNPLSLTPAEIAQYRLAGLELNEELPDVKSFPHRGLPGVAGPRDAKGKRKDILVEDQDDDDEGVKDYDEGGGVKRPSRGPWLRNQHFSVLTTILHRCLQEGDITRASRAWAMLLRMQISGRGIDIRHNGYWEIGAGLLMRSLDKKRRYAYDEEGSDAEEVVEEAEEDATERRWGSREGWEKAKSYYERLILDFPYNRQFQGSVSALDFWPAMISCEIYGIQFEQNEGLRDVQKGEAKHNELDGSGDENFDSDDGDDNPEEDIFTVIQTRKEKIRRKRAAKRWMERDQVRQHALTASEKIAARLDELMAIPPFSDSHNMIRLRGMLALYIGDLSVPEMPIKDDDQDKIPDSPVRSQRAGALDKNTERRFLFRQGMAEHERGKKKQVKERERAARLFDRILRDGGEDDDIQNFSLGQEGLEEEDDSYEHGHLVS